MSTSVDKYMLTSTVCLKFHIEKASTSISKMPQLPHHGRLKALFGDFCFCDYNGASPPYGMIRNMMKPEILQKGECGKVFGSIIEFH